MISMCFGQSSLPQHLVSVFTGAANFMKTEKKVIFSILTSIKRKEGFFPEGCEKDSYEFH